ncbi:hypothetical protein KAX97_05350 [candidate division WOR-3 bacterium]|nr:hypothetical protein [candidate division WOR-3 bacterium]
MNAVCELSMILDKVHNVNTEYCDAPDFTFEPQKETWFDKYILRWV